MRNSTAGVIISASIWLVGCSETNEIPPADSSAEMLISVADASQAQVVRESTIEAYYGNLEIDDHSHFNQNLPD